MCEKELQSKKIILERCRKISIILGVSIFIIAFALLRLLGSSILYGIFTFLAILMFMIANWLNNDVRMIEDDIQYDKAYQKSKNVLKTETRVRYIANSNESLEKQILDFVQYSEGFELTAKFEDENIVLKIKLNNQEKEIELTRNEFRILYYFFTETDCIITKEELLEYLWNDKYYLDESILIVNINRLRSKAKEIGINNLIKTVRGKGYRL